MNFMESTIGDRLRHTGFKGHRKPGSKAQEYMMTKRKTFSKELKLEAVRLLELGDKSPNDLPSIWVFATICSTSGKNS